MTDSLAASTTARRDFQATSDPALAPAADRGEAQLLGYRELYRLWERQQWSVYDLDEEVYGISVDDARAFAARALERRLKAIGLVPAAA